MTDSTAITWQPDHPTGRALLGCRAAVEGGDILEGLLLDTRPGVVSPDRLAAAGVLAFHPWLDRVVRLPEPVSPHVAVAADAFCGSESLTWPATAAASPPPGAGGELVVVADTETGAIPPLDRPGVATLHLRRADWVSGSVVGLRHVTVGTNAYALSRLGARPTDLACLGLAVATLFAEDLSATRLRLDGLPWPGRVEDVARLLEAVDLELVRDR